MIYNTHYHDNDGVRGGATVRSLPAVDSSGGMATAYIKSMAFLGNPITFTLNCILDAGGN